MGVTKVHRFSALPNLVSFRGRKWPGEGGKSLIAAPARPFVRAKSGKVRACPLLMSPLGDDVTAHDRAQD